MPRKQLIQVRRDTATNWTSVNPILADGELGLENSTKKFKYGDGVTPWVDLPYSTYNIDEIDDELLLKTSEVDFITYKTEVSDKFTQYSRKFNSISDLLAYTGMNTGEVVSVTSYWNGGFGGGGIFVYDATKSAVNDNLTVYAGWVRQIVNNTITPQMAGAKGDGTTNDTAAFLTCIAAKNYRLNVPPSVGAYQVNQSLDLNGNYVYGDTPQEYFGSKKKTIIEFDGFNGDAISTSGAYSRVENIWFRQKNWSGGFTINGVRVLRRTYIKDCIFSNFKGHGFYANGTVTGYTSAPYGTVLDQCSFFYNGKHGVAIFNGANTIKLFECFVWWNGASSYGVAPTAVGLYDGLYVDGANADFPAGGSLFEPQGISVYGGDFSYNSRYGQNWHRAFHSIVMGGYLEFNLAAKELRLGTCFGVVISNMFNYANPQLDVVATDPLNTSTKIYTYPNQIRINGRNYSNGIKQAGSGTDGYRQSLPAFFTLGSEAETRMFSSVEGNIVFEAGSMRKVDMTDNIILKARNFRLGTGLDAISDYTTGNFIGSTGNVEGTPYYVFVTGSGNYGVYVANGGGPNAAATFFKAPKNSVTDRSINAGGTVNTSGTDYAEYMTKAPECGNIEKGEVVGVNSDGLLTKKYDEAISFVVKSTDPSFVGGDGWLGEDEPDAENMIEEEYATAKEQFDIAVETKRAKVDRIAFCGQAPIIYPALPGQYILPVRLEDGTIGIEALDTVSYEQRCLCVGKVWRVENNVATIIVFNN